MKIDETGNSANLAIWYRNIPISIEELKDIEGEVTNECRKYLIGKYGLIEKEKRSDNERVADIFEQLGATFGYTGKSIKNLGIFSGVIDRLIKLLPDIAADILNGRTRLAEKDIYALAKLDFVEICAVMERLESETLPAKIIIAEQIALRTKTKRPGRPKRVITEEPRASVKDIPAYDPDAQINGLAYTIPSWVSMIERAFTSSEFNEVSANARNRLGLELQKLTDAAETVSALLSEGK
jgi:hypothetical protein